VTAPVSVVVITKNEEPNIERCLASVRWAAESVVVDSHSHDQTREKAHALGARVVDRDWAGYGPQKNFAISLAENEWILSLDADEEVPIALGEEIAEVVANPEHKAYRVMRPTYFMGRPLKHYGRARREPGQTRLFRKGSAQFDNRLVHEALQVDGSVGFLKAPLLHWCYPTVSTYRQKIRQYAELEAQERAAHWPKLPNRWVRCFGKLGWMLFVRRGILDGPPAWLWITGQAYQDWLATGKAVRLRRGLGTTQARA
jgi:(heptosyl)LPS beta-1,4-glucosyltransferase